MPTQNIFNLLDTWASGGGPYTSIKMNATDNDVGSASLLMDLQVGGSSRFSVGKSGVVTINYPTSGTAIRVVGNGQGLIASSTGSDATGFSGYGIRLQSGNSIEWASSTNGPSGGSIILSRKGDANLRLGAADAASAVPQTLSVQSVVAGTTNTAGANLTITGSQGTGTGAGGSIVFQVAPAGSSGTAQNALATALTIDSGRRINIANNGSSLDASVVSYDSGAGVRSGFYFPNGGGDLAWTRANAAMWGVGFQRCSVGNTSVFSWSSTADPLGAQDVILARDNSGILALRNGASPQSFRVYNTTDGTNSEFGFIRYNSNVLEIGHDSTGTGNNSRNIAFRTQGFNALTLSATTATFNVNVALSTASINSMANIVNQSGYTQMQEMTAPAAPTANNVRIYAEDDGAGKTRLMARFATGAAVQIAIEP